MNKSDYFLLAENFKYLVLIWIGPDENCQLINKFPNYSKEVQEFP